MVSITNIAHCINTSAYIFGLLQSTHWHFTVRHSFSSRTGEPYLQQIYITISLSRFNKYKSGWIFLKTAACFLINTKSDEAALTTALPWHVAAERWLWSCWWVMSIWTSGWERWEICGCCWAGCAGQLRSRCELCPSAPSAETPVPKQDYTQKKIFEFLHASS